ncbi:AAA family ATPase [Salimicrobium halophilum]|uniref:Nuclease SbcCD subunit C n=1 Tax=Salimicrobium halophilum TaxID=86666 RepID=A0A1G8Q374_9BACI|nr:AAA family ATPase [Salimicrobium halophilum]SDI99209.1 exonuclease SbcC [Salimicrobium halophilum]
MEIVELSMQAFGPYLKKQTIPFETLREYPIFLITGATGAGKTSIFDAICFALYGKASGSDRDQETLRSQMATPEEKTYVSFRFRINNHTYQLLRQPKQIIMKERGEGTKEEPAKAELYADPDNENQLLASKVREVDQMIEEMLGLNYEQFRKMMMIPQGEFRKLISENSREREEVLRKIFDTSLYLEVTEQLKNRKSAIEKDIQSFRSRATEELDRIHLEKETELPENPRQAMPFVEQDLKEKETLINEEKKKREKVNEKVTTLQERIRSIENHNSLVQEWQDYLKKQKSSEQYRGEIERKRVEVKRAEEAEKLKAYESQVEEAENHLQDLGKRVKRTEETFHRKAHERTTKQEEQKKIEEQEEERLGLKRRLESLEEAMERLSEIKKKEEEREACNKELERLDVSIEQAERSSVSSRETMETHKKRLSELKNIEETYYEKKEAWNRSKQAFQVLKRLNETTKEKEDIQKRLEDTRKQLNKAEETLAGKKERQKKAVEAKTSDQAYQLSLTLHSEAPCPVCGSVHHPSPASPPREVVDEEEIESIGDSIEKSSEEKERLLSRVYQLQAEEKAKSETIDSLIRELEIEAPSSDRETWTNLLSRYQEEMNRLENDMKELSHLKHEKASTEKEYERLQQDLEKTQETITVAKEKKGRLYQSAATADAEIKEFYRNLPVLEPMEEPSATDLENLYSDIKTTFEAMTKRKKEMEDTLAALSEEISTIQGTWNQLVETQKETEERWKEKKQGFEQTFEQLSFTDKQEYEDSKRTQQYVESIRQEIDSYFQNEAIIKDRIARLENQLGDDTSILPTEEVKKEKEAFEEEMEGLREIIVQKEYEYKQNLDSVDKLNRLLEKQDTSEQLFYDIGDLSSTTSGDNSLRLSLERYVLASYLDEILLQANHRLQTMTDHRYQLKRSEGIAKRGAQSGLDLEVMDQYTAQERSVRTLSGGEGFKAALSLALGMADVVQSYAGGIQLNTLFIDEGFGTLDDISLQQAIECLKNLQDGNRLLGIISHVSQLKEEIPVQMQVQTDGSESAITIRHLGN